MPIIGFFGGLGAGKTLSEVMLAYMAYRSGKQVYSNMPLNFPHIPLNEPVDLLRCNNGFVILDEVWHFFDSRVSGSKVNRALSVILLRSRKRNLFVVYSQQWPYQVDVRLRYVTDYDIYPSLRALPSGLMYLLLWYSNDALVSKIRNPYLYFGLFDTNEDPYTISSDIELSAALGVVQEEEDTVTAVVPDRIPYKAQGESMIGRFGNVLRSSEYPAPRNQ